MNDANKCFSDDTVFNLINKMFITLQDNEVKRNNKYLNLVITALIERMKAKDLLFKIAYKEIIFCGSFYKGTKVGHPNEFDLNIILELPIICDYINFSQTQPAFIQIFVNKELFVFSNKTKYNSLSDKDYRLLKTFICNGFLNPDKVRQWIEGIITKVTSALPKIQDKHYLEIKSDTGIFITKIKVKKSGPAFTLILNDDMHVDLAPALAFSIHLLNGYLKKLTELKGYRNHVWYAIPLPLNNYNSNTIHWRLSFCNQEKELLSKYGRIKPVIRQMKKLRDMESWKCIASYFIETLFLNKLNELKEDLNRIPLTLLFYMMLKELCRACERHKITFFWDERYNLLEKIGKVEMYNISSRLNNIIKNIEKNAMTDKFILAKYILTKHELDLLTARYNRSMNDTSSSSYKEDASSNNGYNCVIL